MYSHQTKLRIHFALTDKMGVVYYGNYAQFYEIGRTEAIRAIGFTYKDIEAMGIIMPVVEMQSHFLRPAKYDDLITIKTTIKEYPNTHQIKFETEIYNSANKILNKGFTILYFIDAITNKKAILPMQLQKKLLPFFG